MSAFEDSWFGLDWLLVEIEKARPPALSIAPKTGLYMREHLFHEVWNPESRVIAELVEEFALITAPRYEGREAARSLRPSGPEYVALISVQEGGVLPPWRGDRPVLWRDRDRWLLALSIAPNMERKYEVIGQMSSRALKLVWPSSLT